MTDPFAGYAGSLVSPPANAFDVTPSDTQDLPNSVRAIYLAVSGDVKVDMVGVGTGLVYPAVPANQWFALRAKRIYATGTTATGIKGGY